MAEPPDRGADPGGTRRPAASYRMDNHQAQGSARSTLAIGLATDDEHWPAEGSSSMAGQEWGGESDPWAARGRRTSRSPPGRPTSKGKQRDEEHEGLAAHDGVVVPMDQSDSTTGAQRGAGAQLAPFPSTEDDARPWPSTIEDEPPDLPRLTEGPPWPREPGSRQPESSSPPATPRTRSPTQSRLLSDPTPLSSTTAMNLHPAPVVPPPNRSRALSSGPPDGHEAPYPSRQERESALFATHTGNGPTTQALMEAEAASAMSGGSREREPDGRQMHRGSPVRGDSHMEEKKQEGETASIAQATVHPIHNKPSQAYVYASPPTLPPPPLPTTGRSWLAATLSPAAPVGPSTSPLDAEVERALEILPGLLRHLVCRACGEMMEEPTTLPCGHSACLSCMVPVGGELLGLGSVNPRSSRQHAPPEGATESLFARNPPTPLTTPAGASRGMVRSASGSNSSAGSAPAGPSSLLSGLISTIGGGGAHSSASRAVSPSASSPPATTAPSRHRYMCPHPSCRKVSSTMTSIRPDVVLQNVVHLVSAKVPVELLDEMWAQLRREEDDLENELALAQEEGLEGARSGRHSSVESHSSGGGEDPIDDETKRVHRGRNWTSSKRQRRGFLRHASPDDAAIDDEELALRPRRLLPRRSLDDSAKSLSPTFMTELQAELECQVCVQLFYEPLTTPCGHTYCRKCLARSLDHSEKCPLCRADLPGFNYFQKMSETSTTQLLVGTAFDKLNAERKRTLELEALVGDLNTAIFVDSLAWPTLPHPLYIFEPRYRLMMRRVTDSGGDGMFGMVLPSRNSEGVAEFGTMLKVTNQKVEPDGTSWVETVGMWRFRILEKGMLDGYVVAKVERLDDLTPDQEAALERSDLARNPPPGRPLAEGQQLERSMDELIAICRDFEHTLSTGHNPWVMQRLHNTIGSAPDDPAAFTFWMAEIMPLPEEIKAQLLPCTSVRERLKLLVFWIEQFKQRWWFQSGCSIS